LGRFRPLIKKFPHVAILVHDIAVEKCIGA